MIIITLLNIHTNAFKLVTFLIGTKFSIRFQNDAAGVPLDLQRFLLQDKHLWQDSNGIASRDGSSANGFNCNRNACDSKRGATRVSSVDHATESK